MTDFLFPKKSLFFSPFRFCCFRTHKEIQNLSMNDLTVKPNSLFFVFLLVMLWFAHLLIPAAGLYLSSVLQFSSLFGDFSLASFPFVHWRPWQIKKVSPAPQPLYSDFCFDTAILSSSHYCFSESDWVFRFHLESSHTLYLRERQKHTKIIHTGSLFFYW